MWSVSWWWLNIEVLSQAICEGNPLGFIGRFSLQRASNTDFGDLYVVVSLTKLCNKQLSLQWFEHHYTHVMSLTVIFWSCWKLCLIRPSTCIILIILDSQVLIFLCLCNIRVLVWYKMLGEIYFLFLIHWGLNNMADILHITFSNAFSSKKICIFGLNLTKFCSQGWFTMSQDWFR